MEILGSYKRKSPWSVSASRAKGACVYLTTKRRLGHSMNQFCLSKRSQGWFEKRSVEHRSGFGLHSFAR